MSTPVIASDVMKKDMRTSKRDVNKVLPAWAVHQSPTQSPYEDDCEEYVPLSPPNVTTPLGNVSFLNMMTEAMNDSPRVIPKYESPPPEDNAPPDALEVMKASEVEEVVERGKLSKGTKRPRASGAMWKDASTHALLHNYHEVWLRINRGNLRTKDWEDVTFGVNKETGLTYNSQQVRNRIDTLKKTYKDENKKQAGTGSTPRLVGALDSDEHRNTFAGTSTQPLPEDIDDMDSPDTTPQKPESPRNTMSENPPFMTAGDSTPKVDSVDLEGVVGKKVKKSKRSLIGTLSKSMDNNMDKMVAMMEKVEMNRMALQERLAQMQCNMQLEMAKNLCKS